MSKTVVIVDLEATCEQIKDPRYISEIIEIGAVKIVDGKIVDKFAIFIKPTIHPILSDFCKELTSITQEDVDNGEDRKTALMNFREFCKDTDVILSWGMYDRNQLGKECSRHGIEVNWLKRHRNLKEEFSLLLGREKQYGMAKALSIAGLKLDGTHHRGIDDATNIGKIYIKYKDQWPF